MLILLALLMMLVAGCGDGGGSGDSSDESTGSSDSAPTPTDNTGLGDYEGLCAWASPEKLEKIFGKPVDAVGFKECRIVAEGNVSDEGIFHVSLDQLSSFEQFEKSLKTNQSVDKSTICDQELTRYRGMRILRSVICPKAGSEVKFGPNVVMELDDGRLLTSLPQPAADKQSAVEASEVFVKIFKVFADQMQGLPVINEVKPGSWLELYNPGKKPVDLAGYQIKGIDGRDESMAPGSIDVPSGSKLKPGGRLVIGLTGLTGNDGDEPVVQLTDGQGRLVDSFELDYTDPDEVQRRNGDGGPICAAGSDHVTKGAPNPPQVEFCDP